MLSLIRNYSYPFCIRKRGKMKMRNSLKKIIASAAIIAAMQGRSAVAQDKKIELDTGYNALETLVTEDRDIRTRAWLDVGVSVYNLRFGYHGMHEANNLDDDTYFGKHMATLGKKDAGISLVGIVKATQDGSIDEKAGIRDTSLVNALGGYGRIDAAANGDAVSVLLFYGRPIANGTTIELTHEVTLPHDGIGANYTELQVNKSFVSWLSVVGRIEIYDLKETKAKVGIAIHK